MKKTFASAVTELAIKDERVVLITGDYCFGMFDYLKLACPKQYINVGTCEQTMVGFAAGLAIAGRKPFVYTITPFLLERAFEQIKLDVDFNDLSVAMVGYAEYPSDGPTHKELSCYGMVRLLKNTALHCPADSAGVVSAVVQAYHSTHPTFIRLSNLAPAAARGWPAEGRDA